MSLRFYYTRCHRKERPYDRLYSYSLNSVDGSYEPIFESVYLDIESVIHYRRDREYE
jgi:hypothetical protein